MASYFVALALLWYKHLQKLPDRSINILFTCFFFKVAFEQPTQKMDFINRRKIHIVFGEAQLEGYRLKKNKLSIGVGQKHSVTMGKASLIGLLIGRVWALRHQKGEQFSAAECTIARVAVHNVVAPAPRFDSANRLKSPTRVVNFFQSDSRFRRNVSALFNFMPSYIGSAM